MTATCWREQCVIGIRCEIPNMRGKKRRRNIPKRKNEIRFYIEIGETYSDSTTTHPFPPKKNRRKNESMFIRCDYETKIDFQPTTEYRPKTLSMS